MLMLHSHVCIHMLHSLRQTSDSERHLVNGAEKKQTVRMEGRRNEKHTTMCCYSDVVLFTVPRMEYNIFNEIIFMTIICSCDMKL